jgi:hypothetical protein
MAPPKEAADSPSPKPVLPEKGKEIPANPEPPLEKQYRVYNSSGQTLYVVNSEGTHALPPGEHYDLPFAKISYHLKLMARRGFIALYEKEEKTS